MKKLYFLVTTFLFITIANAQIVNIPDANFKAKLLQASTSNAVAQNSNNMNIKIDTNNDGEIQVSEALLVYRLNASYGDINDLTGIESFTNLQILYCYYNQLTVLNVSELNNLIDLRCYANQLTSLDVSELNNLTDLRCHVNQLTSLNVSGSTNLQFLDCSVNQLTTIDVSDLPNMKHLVCMNNQLTTLFLKNSNLEWWDLAFQNNPNLQYICADNEDVVLVQQKITQYGYTNCHANSYCSFTPGGTFYTIQGTNRMDTNNDGCTAQDVVYPNLKLNFTNGSISGSTISNDSGNYNVPVSAGTHTFTTQIENPSYFNISPTSTSVSFPVTPTPFTQNFCITPNGVHHDLEIVIIPIGVAQPGFDAFYKIIYKNKGNQTENATINFNFNDDILDFVASSVIPTSQNVDILTWNVGTLLPFQSGEILVTLNVNSPMEIPAVNGGDLLNYSTSINGLNTDENQEDNYFVYNQIVVNSYDPNDKECLEGTIINPNNIGNYVHYKIRFENTGTYPAQNIVVKDEIDTTKFDISTLQITDTSHSCVTRITNPNKVEFIFENINLPFDDATNDGYVVFKIKTKPTLVAGNTISNLANIYFDYNFPIVTNTSTSTFATLGINEVENKSVVVYPNPTTGIVNVNCNDTIKNIALYDIQGRLLMTKIVDSQNATFELSNQNTGTYFVKVITDNGVKIEKVFKN